MLLSCRGFTAHQAHRFLQLQRLQAARRNFHAEDDSEDEQAAEGIPVDSYPISVSRPAHGMACGSTLQEKPACPSGFFKPMQNLSYIL